MSSELRASKMQVVYRTWTDVKRAKGSSLGSNITDGQFFAVAPESERAGKNYKTLPSNQSVCFPAVRPPNLTDEVDIEKPEHVSFKATNRDGVTETVASASEPPPRCNAVVRHIRRLDALGGTPVAACIVRRLFQTT